MTKPNLSDLFDNLSFQIPSMEELEAQAAAQLRAAKAPFEVPGSKAFIGTSLKAWLDVVQAAGVPSVPAQALTAIHRQDFLRFEESLVEKPEVWAAFEAALAGVADTHMVRWDACAPLDLKYAMASKAAPSAETRRMGPDDPRAYDILTDYPADEFTVWMRPWVQARMEEGFPVEFRVFVREGQVLGVASYYPQRALPDTPEMRGLAEQCVDRTNQVLAHLAATGEYPWLTSYAGMFTEGTVNATLDFLVTSNNEVVFLEAGPPFGAGAHPCAFIDRPVNGIALALAPGVQLR